MPREQGVKVVANNKRAKYDFSIEETFEAGLVLTGTEVKSLRGGKASLADSFATISDGEAWLENAYIPEFGSGSWTNHAPRRRRKLLLTKREVSKLAGKSRESGYALVPTSLYFRDGYAKVEIGLGKGKKAFDKRESLRERDANREIERASRRTRDAG